MPRSPARIWQAPIDYDPGASHTNQTNRLKLLMTVAKDNLNKQISERKSIEIENIADNMKKTQKKKSTV